MKGIKAAFPPLPTDAVKPVVLGCDQSSNFGWAVLSPSMRAPVCGLLRLPVAEDETPALLAIHEHIARLIPEHGIGHVFFEQPFVGTHGHVPSTRRQDMYIAAIMLATALCGLPSAKQVPIQGWRKAFTGHGAAPPGITIAHERRKFWKGAAIKGCAERGWLIEQHDVAEAVGIASFGLCTVSPEYAARDAPIFRRAQTKQEVWVR